MQLNRMKREKKNYRRSFLALLLCMFLASNLAAQSPDNQGRKITFRCEKEKLHKALAEIERLSGYYRVQYVMNDVSPYTVSVNLQNESMENAVKQLLKDTPLKYEISNRFIQVFNPKTGSNRKSQGNTLRGVVYDETGEPLIGVTVRNKESKEGTVTDLNGEFSLPAMGGEIAPFYFLT